jgi:hypothetical protein
VHHLSVLLHKIARWAVPFLTVPSDVRRRAEAGLLTPADCRLIADQLGSLGRSLTTPADAEQAARLGRETVRLMRLAEEDEEVRGSVQGLYEISERRPWPSYLQPFLSCVLRNRRQH